MIIVDTLRADALGAYGNAPDASPELDRLAETGVLFERVIAPYRSAAEVVWAQEETRNRGGWSFMMPRLFELFPDCPVRYVGREPSASPATGSSSIHREQQARLVREALEIPSE